MQTDYNESPFFQCFLSILYILLYVASCFRSILRDEQGINEQITLKYNCLGPIISLFIHN